MSYLESTGMGAVAAGRSLAAVRIGLARLLSSLEALPATLGDKKFLRSDDPVMVQDAPELRTITKPTLWTGSNVIAWPVADWKAREADWDAAIAALAIAGDLRAFALQRKLAVATTTRKDAITAARELLARVDQAMGRSSIVPWLLAAGAVGLAWVASKPGKAKRTVRRLFKKRVSRTFYARARGRQR